MRRAMVADRLRGEAALAETPMKITVTVKPNARKNSVEKDAFGYRVYTSATPVDGKANEAVIGLLAEYFDVPRSRMRILRGHASRTKTIEVDE